MRGADSFNAALFSTLKLDEFVPQTHPLRPIRKWMNEAGVKGGRPSMAPEKLMRAMLLHVLYSVHSERQIVKQTSFNLLFRWFVGLSIEDAVWNHSVFGKTRDRLIEFDAVTDLSNATVKMADKRGLLSGEHFSVDGTLIHAWASRKSVRRKDGGEDDRPPEDWHGENCSNDTHASMHDPESRLYRKSSAAPALPNYQGHVLTDNRHGLVVNVQASAADGCAERDVDERMLSDVAKRDVRIMVGADTGYDMRCFVKARRKMNVTPHVAQSTKRTGGSAIGGRTTRHAGYAVISASRRKRIEQDFGWGKTIGPIRQIMVRGAEKADQLLTLTMAAYILTRMRTLANVRPQCV
ncbi:IS5 family transposase [Thiomonas sp. FB-Cd]|uniref:IS5 family transposase n=1 Tax=Thiomonas sp. FB-Cd TaxID=1158292 RepID=UPI0004DF5338|nr:IS5 family transposase [Thiomonas sp. FB-Cd]